MMKNKLNHILIALALLMASCQSSTQKTAFIRTPQLLAAYKGNQVAEAAMKKEKEAVQQQLDSLLQAFRQEVVVFEEKRPKMGAKALQERQQQLASKQRQLQNYEESQQQALQQQQQEAQQKVLDEVTGFIKKYGKEHGYAYIHGATYLGNLVYADESYDLTKVLTEELNKAYDKGELGVSINQSK